MSLRRLISESRRLISEHSTPQVGMVVTINAMNSSVPAMLQLVKGGLDLPSHAEGEWEIYNMSSGMVHMARLERSGKKAPPSKKNMLNVTPQQFNELTNAGVFQPK